jgi:hypothetical protein
METSPKANVYTIGVLYLRSRGAIENTSGFTRTIKREALEQYRGAIGVLYLLSRSVSLGDA